MFWAWYVFCQLAAFAFYWMPLHIHGFWIPPLGFTFVALMCLFKAWDTTAHSIKPLPVRIAVDEWKLPVNAVFGNPEDGVSGADAVGPNWVGRFNPALSVLKAIEWNSRNWMAGINYITWRWAPEKAPIYFGTCLGRSVKFGWQQLPASDGWTGPYKVRMVCSL